MDKLIKEYDKPSFFQYKRTYSNNKINEKTRSKLFNGTINFLDKINSHRKKTTFMPTFATLKPYMDKENSVSIRTYQNIIKENDFYLPSCDSSTKRLINKRIRNLKSPPKHIEIIEEMETIKLQRKYKGGHLILVFLIALSKISWNPFDLVEYYFESIHLQLCILIIIL